MFKSPLFLRCRLIVPLAALAVLAGCSGGGGCGSCAVPAFHATPVPGTTPTPVPGTTPTPSPTPTPVALSCNQGGSAITFGPQLAPFALLAGTTITNVGNTIVNGPVVGAANSFSGNVADDLVGIWPGTAETGFSPSGTGTIVPDGTNAIYALTPPGLNTNRTIPQNAQGGLINAYNATAGRASTATVAGDLGGQTLLPGVYTSTSTLLIAAGNLTLSGGGNPQSVFVFQVASALTTNFNGGAGGNVILTNGASACNVYWQVGSSATVNGQTFSGNVLANGSITIGATGTTFVGRALAENGAVSISNTSTITNPGGN